MYFQTLLSARPEEKTPHSDGDNVSLSIEPIVEKFDDYITDLKARSGVLGVHPDVSVTLVAGDRAKEAAANISDQ